MLFRWTARDHGPPPARGAASGVEFGPAIAPDSHRGPPRLWLGAVARYAPAVQTFLDIDHLRVRRPRLRDLRSRAWREWCFARSVIERLWIRFAVLGLVLIAGALLFRRFEGHSFAQSLYYTFLLIFGEPPQDFPDRWPLRLLFFLVPIVGLTVIIEGVVELATLVRDRRRNERAWCRIMAESMHDHVILVGLGRLGFRTYTVLRQLGVPMVVLELDERNQFLGDVRRHGAPLLIGDARREALLVDANVGAARAIILATTDDLANLEIALDARKINPDIRVVLRLFDQNMADKVREGFGISTAMSQSSISAPAFATAALDDDIVSSTVIDDQLVVTVHWRIGDDDQLAGRTVADLMESRGVQVLRLRRPGEPQGSALLFPPPATILGAGDEMLVQGLYERLRTQRPRRDRAHNRTRR